RDDVVDVRVALDRHQLVDAHAARHADATEVVALEVDEHHVLGTLLRMRDELTDVAGVVMAVHARPRAGDGARLHLAPGDRTQPPRNGTSEAAGRAMRSWRHASSSAGKNARASRLASIRASGNANSRSWPRPPCGATTVSSKHGKRCGSAAASASRSRRPGYS